MAESEQGESAVVVVKAYDFNVWLLPKVEKFARSHKFSVGLTFGQHARRHQSQLENVQYDTRSS
jgi:hypothetical protein